MSIKRVPFGSKPSAKPAETADDWVNNRSLLSQ